jgi:hypothetical protein
MWLKKNARKEKSCIPDVYYYGSQYGKNFMVMDLLGPSLDSLHEKHGKKFSVFTVTKIALQLLDSI